jgi:adenylate cyclase
MSGPKDSARGSEARLWQLVAERALPGADRERIDQRIWELFGEDWAVMFTDLAGFSRQVAAFGIIHLLQIIHEQQEVLAPIISDHDGILMKAEGDSLMILFRRASRALECGIAMQRACQRENASRPPETQILLCLGIGFGRVLRAGDSDCYGQEVNAASKLGEDSAAAHEILVTGAVRDLCRDLSGIRFEERAEPVAGCDRSYRVEYGRA